MIKVREIFKYYIKEVLTHLESEDSYISILEKTQGAWTDDKTWDKTEKRRRLIEKAASFGRKNIDLP